MERAATAVARERRWQSGQAQSVQEQAAEKARQARRYGALIERRARPRTDSDRVLDEFYRQQRAQLKQEVREDILALRAAGLR